MCNSQSFVLLGLTVLLTIIVAVKSRPDITIKQHQTYSSKAGNPVHLNHNPLTQATEESKNNTDLNLSTQLEEQTKELFSDKVRNQHNFLVTFWNVQNITYKILNCPPYLEKTDVEKEFARAFAAWSQYTNLTFTLKNDGEVDISIKFVRKDHGDKYPFNGRASALAHATEPHVNAFIHFDDDEYWYLGSKNHDDMKKYKNNIVIFPVNLFIVSVHEIGHALGLEHSSEKSSIMSPSHNVHYDQNFKLSDFDIEGIQYLYGSKSSPNIIGPFGEFTGPGRNKSFLDLLPDYRSYTKNCTDPKFDAIFNSADNQTYLLKGKKYINLSKDSVSSYPELISKRWAGLPGDIDAAFEYKDGKIYFFKGTKHWRYNGSQMDDGYPKEISEGFPGIPSHLDTAMSWYDSGKIFFFKGSKFWSYDPAEKPSVKSNYIRIYSNWKGLPLSPDAAFVDFNRYTYFFKDNSVYKIKDYKNLNVPRYTRLIRKKSVIKLGCLVDYLESLNGLSA